MHNILFNTMAEYEAVKDTIWAGEPPIVVGIKADQKIIWKNSVPPPPVEQKWVTFEGPVTWENYSTGATETSVGIRTCKGYFRGAGLEYSIDDVPTTWTPIEFPSEKWDSVYISPTTLGVTYDKIHIRACDGGNDFVGTLRPICSKVSGPILSLLDNTLSITELSNGAFDGGCDDYGYPCWNGLFMATNIEGFLQNNYLEDASGIIMPTLPIVDAAYANMFAYQSNLTSAPTIDFQLPNGWMGDSYVGMFDSCYKLSGVFNLPDISDYADMYNFTFGVNAGRDGSGLKVIVSGTNGPDCARILGVTNVGNIQGVFDDNGGPYFDGN